MVRIYTFCRRCAHPLHICLTEDYALSTKPRHKPRIMDELPNPDAVDFLECEACTCRRSRRGSLSAMDSCQPWADSPEGRCTMGICQLLVAFSLLVTCPPISPLAGSSHPSRKVQRWFLACSLHEVLETRLLIIDVLTAALPCLSGTDCFSGVACRWLWLLAYLTWLGWHL